MDIGPVRTLAIGLTALGLSLLAAAPAAGGEIAPVRLPASEIPWPETTARVEGTGMRAGLQVLVVAGDAKSNGLYTMMFKLPANRRVPPHSHPDVRSCFVLSGTFYFAYGDTWDDTLLQALPAGSHYTEPAGMNHFAASRDEDVIAECTAVGPTGTTFVNPADDPRRQQ
ncbi:MAG TPA: cupin domain-containing protein [Burkholderiales bacterium]|nr:cupin domain-containing protein [Burkholderiales bacterium]